MVTVREKTSVTQRIRGNCPTHSRTEISVREWVRQLPSIRCVTVAFSHNNHDFLPPVYRSWVERWTYGPYLRCLNYLIGR